MPVARSRSLATFVVVVLTTVDCDDPIAPPVPGAIRVVVTPSGEDISTNELRVSVVNGPTRQVNPTLELTILGMAPGVYTLRLDGGMPDMCFGHSASARYTRRAWARHGETGSTSRRLTCAQFLT